MSRTHRHHRARAALAAAALWGAACASFQPVPLNEVPFRERAQTQRQGKIEVTVAVLTKEESRQVFGVNLARHKIQPVWVKVRNDDDIEYAAFPVSVDPNYFSSQEAAWKSHFAFSGKANDQMDRYFFEQALPILAAPGETISGFVFTNLDDGVKVVNVDVAATKSKNYSHPVSLSKGAHRISAGYTNNWVSQDHPDPELGRDPLQDEIQVLEAHLPAGRVPRPPGGVVEGFREEKPAAVSLRDQLASDEAVSPPELEQPRGIHGQDLSLQVLLRQPLALAV